MGLKRYKPVTAGLRHRVANDFSEITHVGLRKV